MKIYNTLTRQKEDFAPLTPRAVKMYVCGITPYDETHLGHGRAYVTFDVVKRYLEYCGFAVMHIQNITDIDDKIIQKAENRDLKIENRKSEERCRDITEQYIASYLDVMDKLNVKRANVYPKATEHIPEMIQWISQLIMKGVAYELPDGIYFAVDKFDGYGKLSGRKPEEMEAGARVEVHGGKKNPFDFALWKKAKEGEPSWDSPWGAGRPGWHIECSVMSTKYLGEQFDIHGGGMDLEFPHHENEIAQTESFTGKVPWVKYWMHNGFVNVNQQKMSKSLGNFFAMKDILKKYPAMVVRLFLLMTHYRSPINFSDEQLDEAKTAYDRIIKTVEHLDFLISKVREPEADVEVLETEDELAVFKTKFENAMDEDFNTASAIGVIFDFISFINKHVKKEKIDAESLKKYKALLFEFCGILGILLHMEESESVDKNEIEKLIEERNDARKSKNFKRADEIRKLLSDKGIILEDTAFGTKW